ncbi:SDR family oxidoreductase [Bacteroides heparinolyticus]|uniref:7-alpha-hydroxysteroid dehydrogenase n=1 Tax=Prevotella heparinolytica TaxID=28113 RepID=A0A449I808_9BACE|nr:SDR family oxidoreductase [Bacteroides heparinolyticus]MCI6213161.1 SDR family oxidoreductase [Bacteroides heparinolyticus]VFB15460.1 7-alpha-hydroxysteroid dehydrogenase [Bacteroides heparinolyticus]
MNTLDLFSLKNKVAIITGGCGHLGKAMTESLHDAGAIVYVAGTSIDKFKSIYQDCSNIRFVQLDIMSSESIHSVFSDVYNREGHIDVLINNAAYVEGGGKLPEQISDKEWTNCQEGVMGSVFKCIREVIPFMPRGGSIVNIASMYGLISPDLSMYNDVCSPFLNPVDYGAGKAGVIQITKYFGTYLIGKGIRVNCISPGTFPSPKVQKNEEFVRRLSKKNPANRIGVPEDIKGAVLFLSSNASGYVVGQNIQVDGGWTIW